MLNLFIALIIVCGWSYAAGATKGALDKRGIHIGWIGAFMFPVMLPLLGATQAAKAGYSLGEQIQVPVNLDLYPALNKGQEDATPMATNGAGAVTRN